MVQKKSTLNSLPLFLLFTFFASSSCTSQPDPTVRPEMRDAYQTVSELYGYVWNEKLFMDPKFEPKIELLLSKLSNDFHKIEVKAPLEMFEPGFTVTLAAQQTALADISKRFKQGSKEYALWRLESVPSNCISCHSRYNAPTDFFGSAPSTGSGSMEEQLKVAKFLFATRQFVPAAEKLYSIAQNAATLPAGDIAFRALQLWLTIEVRVKSRFKQAAHELQLLLPQAHFKPYERQAVDSWIEQLQELDAGLSGDENLKRAELLLESTLASTSVDDDNKQLVKTLRASTILHSLLLRKENVPDRRRATYLLAVAYAHLPIQSFEGLKEFYLEQCIREFPNTEEAQRAFMLFKDIFETDNTGSDGLHLDKEDARRLQILRNLAYGEDGPGKELLEDNTI